MNFLKLAPFAKLGDLACCLLVAVACAGSAGGPAQPWSVEKADRWAQEQPWYCGVNYIPATAVNYTAMWDRTSFDPETMEKEMSLMSDLGMNCARFVMQYAVYADNPRAFKRRLDKFLSICDAHGVKAMPIFFDDCAFGANTDPVTGKQPEPLEGWYAWAWSPSPGYTMVWDERTHGLLEKYVKDVLTSFADDPRILAWDLYNEPTNTRDGARSWPLLEKTFRWAREAGPSQPVTSGLWNGDEKLNEYLAANSDIITFHCYAGKEETLDRIAKMKAYGRPVICTEWMNRPAKSLINEIMPAMKEAGCGSMIWGLVNGKTQTDLCWGHRPEMLPYTGPWQHDIFRGDHTPYDASEIETVKSLTR